MASRYESIVNVDGVACEFTQALRAKSWYYIGMSRAMLTARRRAAAEVDGGGMQLAGGISRAYRAYIATLKTREQANEIIVVPWNADGPPLEVQLISAAACSLVAADTSLGSAPMALNLIYKVLMLELLKYDYGCASVRSRARGVCVCV